jgi:hypothetical protein
MAPPMTITIPESLVTWTCIVLYVATALLLLAALLFGSTVLIHRWLQRRKVYGCAIVWLTARSYRDNAQQWTYGILTRVEQLLRESNSPLHAWVKELFNRP